MDHDLNMKQLMTPREHFKNHSQLINNNNNNICAYKHINTLCFQYYCTPSKIAIEVLKLEDSFNTG